MIIIVKNIIFKKYLNKMRHCNNIRVKEDTYIFH